MARYLQFCIGIMNLHLAKLLIKQDLVTIDQIRSAMEHQLKEGTNLGESLVDLGYTSQEQLMDILSREYGVPVQDIEDLSIEDNIIELIPRNTAVDNCLIPISISGSELTVAMADPSNLLLIDDLSFVTGNTINPVLSLERSIKNKLSKYYIDAHSDVELSPDAEISFSDVEETSNKPLKNSYEDDRSIDELIVELEEFKFGAKVNEAVNSAEFSSEPDVAFEQDLIVCIEENSNNLISSTDDVAEDGQSIKSVSNIDDIESMVQPTQDDDILFALHNLDFEIGSDNSTDRSMEISFPSEEEEAGQQSEQSDIIVVSNNEIIDEVSDHNFGFQSPLQAPESEEVKSEPQNSTQHQFSAPTTNTDNRSGERGVIDESANNVVDHQSEPHNELVLVPSFREVPVEAESPDHPDTDKLLLEGIVPGQEVESTGIKIREFMDPEMGIEAFGDQAAALSAVEYAINGEDKSTINILEPQDIMDEEQASVLLIDDSPIVQKIVTTTLEKNGYKVFTAGDSIEALSKLNEIKPNLIFVDINLPHMDGYQLCKIIKSYGLTKDVPVVMLSGKDGFFNKMRGRMVGANGYIIKPFEPDVLVEAAHKYSKL